MRTGLNLIFIGLLLPGCFGAAPPTATPDLVATEVAVQRTAAAILTAEVPTTAPPVETPTPTATSLPADTPLPPATADQPASLPTATPTSMPVCTVLTNDLRLRSGPGTAYEILAALAVNTTLTPLAFSPLGYPEGQWLHVQVVAGGQLGWVIIGQQYLSCSIDAATLPPGAVPPTPLPTPTNTPLPVPPTPTREAYAVMGDPEGGGSNYIDGGILFPTLPPRYIDQSETILFRDRLVFRVETYDVRRGNFDGQGIETVDFRLTYLDDPDEGEITVYQNLERDPSYCVFPGTEPCPVLVFAQQGYRWPDGRPIENGNYRADIVITPRDKTPDENGEVEANWLFNFRIEGLPPTHPPAESDLVARIVQTGPNSDADVVSDALVFQVEAYNPATGNHDGAGIDRVDMRIIGPSGQVYRNTEQNAAYCAFEGGEPNCNVWVFAKHGYQWPNGHWIEPGFYTLQATVYAKNGQTTTVETDVEIQPGF